MHHYVWPTSKREKPIDKLLWRKFAHLNINIFCSEGTPTDRPAAWQTDHAVSTSSVDAAACLMLTELELVRGSGGQMEAPHGSHAFEKSRRVGATNSPQMEKVWEGHVGRGRCRVYNLLSSCTVLPNTKHLITAPKKSAKGAGHGQNCSKHFRLHRGLETGALYF